ncbi:NB-ARC domain-containing protein [Streptomyces sp. DSM 44917]|uniref:NB-ARC domain-containing protein n=1 Tax=Streptomyces boetiae TaxID=3075541 RepID=A0ABU2L4Q4_9ACTN|nr:NB-ARC domain-containing protein [Streptomyces sp. DSM 44917]MDT0306401.1 NB-ARC domain-containing protein [Streptomyces sp. DSM 44917]
MGYRTWDGRGGEGGRVELLTTAAVLAAVESVTSDVVAGATGEFGRRASEALAGLARRLWRRDGEDGEGGPGDGEPVLPETAEERRELARRLLELAGQDPEFARDLEGWLRDSAGVVEDREREARRALARPRLLPPGTPAFTDREGVLDTLTALADAGAAAPGGPRVVVLLGPGGIGKTATAVHAAHALAGRYPDGQLYADLRGASAATAASPSEILGRFLPALGLADGAVPGEERRQVDRYRDLTAGRRLLVLLDNAHSAAQVVPLLTASSGSLVLVTSRYRLPELVRDHGARLVPLGPLEDADAVRLLARIAGPERVARQPAHVAAVARSCAGVPLALCATGARAAEREHLSWERIVRELSPENGAFSGEEEPDGRDPVLLATHLSYRELSPPAARLYRLLGQRPWPQIPVGAAAAAAGPAAGPEASPAEEDQARALLEELARVHLLEEVAEERYRFHDAVRRHAARQAAREESPAELARATGRMARWFLRRAAEADAAVLPGRWRLGPAFPGPPPPGAPPRPVAPALAWLRRERENLAEAVRAAEEQGSDGLVWQLCEATWSLHLKLGFHQQQADTHARGVAAARRAAEDFGDARAEGRMRVQHAFALMGLGRTEEAEEQLRDAAEADRRAGHRRGQATAEETLGLLRLRQWRWAEAEAAFARARETLGLIAPDEEGARDVPRATALLAFHTGRALRGDGRLTEAVRRLLEALALFGALEVPDPYNGARVRTALGETLLDAGDPGAARAPLDEALEVLSAEGAWLPQAEAALLRARCARDLGDAEGEAAFLRTARKLYERTGELAAAARVEDRLARLGGDGP